MNLHALCLLIVCVVVLFGGSSQALGTSNCPSASRIDNCSPKCKDSSCPGAQICCTNICGTKSCTDINQYQNSNKNGGGSNKYSSGGASCGNTKCQPNEKCELDRSTKRQKCVRN